MFYVGNTFDKKVNKGYKTIKNAKKEAEKNGLSVWDEEGVKLYPLKVEVTDDVDLCQYFEHKKLKGYADFFNSSSSFCCGVI